MLICQNSEINVLVDLLRKDEVVAVPTDTVFGVCARYDHIQAQENLRDLKKRPETKAFPIMCADMEQVLQICEMCEEEISMARLRAKPTAKYCIVCREIIEKGKK